MELLRPLERSKGAVTALGTAFAFARISNSGFETCFCQFPILATFHNEITRIIQNLWPSTNYMAMIA